MRMARIAMVFCLLLALLVPVNAVQLFYNSNMDISLEKEEFSAGETMKVDVRVLNLEPFPIAEAYLIAHLVRGEEYYYPSQTSNADNVFAEKKVPEINVAGNSKIDTTFSMQLPSDLKPGSYRLDVYAKTGKTHMVGAPHIFLSPKTIYFTVSGQGEFPEAKILRTKTFFHRFASNNRPATGPVGAGIEAGDEIENNVFVKNVSARDLKNLALFVGLCEWDDTSCEEFTSTATEEIASLKAGEEASVNVKFNAPLLPDAYAIRIELKDESGRLLSLYRNRSIVQGPTAKIHQLNISDYLFEQGDEAKLSVLIGSSPDHYTYPDFKNFTLKAWIEDIKQNDKVIFSKTESIALLRYNQFDEKEFSFNAPNRLDLFRVCASIEKQGTEHEHYCYVVDASKFPSKDKGSEIDMQWDYDDGAGILNIFFSNENPNTKEIKAAFILMDFSVDNMLATGNLQGPSPIIEKVSVQPAYYTLIVNNFATGRQSKFIIDLKKQPTAFTAKPCAELHGVLCRPDQYCENTVESAEAAACCLSACKDRVRTAPQEFPWEMYSSLVFWAVVILAVILVASAIAKRMGGKESEEVAVEEGDQYEVE